MSDATDALADALWSSNAVSDQHEDDEVFVTCDELRALARDAYDLAQADLAAAQAVIEQVREANELHAADYLRAEEWMHPGARRQTLLSRLANRIDAILAQSSSSVLAARDAEVAAKGWDEGLATSPHAARCGLTDPKPPKTGARVCTCWRSRPNPYRAQALRDGQETT